MDWEKALDAVNQALTVIKTIADTPGVNMLPYVSTLSGAIGAIQAAASVGKNILPYVEAIKDTFDKDHPPTAADMAALDLKIAALEAEVYKPLGPPEEGEED